MVNGEGKTPRIPPPKAVPVRSYHPKHCVCHACGVARHQAQVTEAHRVPGLLIVPGELGPTEASKLKAEWEKTYPPVQHIHPRHYADGRTSDIWVDGPKSECHCSWAARDLPPHPGSPGRNHGGLKDIHIHRPAPGIIKYVDGREVDCPACVKAASRDLVAVDKLILFVQDQFHVSRYEAQRKVDRLLRDGPDVGSWRKDSHGVQRWVPEPRPPSRPNPGVVEGSWGLRRPPRPTAPSVPEGGRKRSETCSHGAIRGCPYGCDDGPSKRTPEPSPKRDPAITSVGVGPGVLLSVIAVLWLFLAGLLNIQGLWPFYVFITLLLSAICALTCDVITNHRKLAAKPHATTNPTLRPLTPAELLEAHNGHPCPTCTTNPPTTTRDPDAP